MAPTDVDVLVAGGGPAGIGAAVAAARAGARTLLLERHGFLGGVAAHGMGMPINQMLPGGRSRGAVHDLLIASLRAYGEEAARVVGHALVCNVSYLKAAALDVLDQAGCSYLLHSFVAGAIVEEGRVAGVIAATKAGEMRLRAKVVADATGDMDVAHFAGAATMKGREDGYLSPMTLCLIINGIEAEAAYAFAEAGGCQEVLARGRAAYPLLPETMMFEPGRLPLRNSIVINHAGTKLAGPLDATDPEQMTRAEHHLHHQAIQIVEALRAFGGPVFRDVQLAATGAQAGVRETRRLKGLYVLTEEDAKTGRRFPDAIAWRSGYLDVGFTRWEPMQVHDVPYRALVPETMDGLLVAGRGISATHVGAACGKSMGNCMATGHAAGLAAALCAADGVRPRDVEVPRLQAALGADGVDLTRGG